MSAAPYRIAGERPGYVEPLAPPAPARLRPAEGEAEIETVACEYNTPAEPEPFPTGQVLGGFAIGGSIAVAVTALILLLTGWS